MADEGHWLVLAERYWEELGHFPDEVLLHAYESAWRAFPEWFPALGDMEQHVKATEKSVAPDRLNLPEGDPFAGPDGAAKCREILAKINAEVIGK